MSTITEDQQAIDAQWSATTAQVEIPESMAKDFFAKSGNLPLHHHNSRKYNRYFFRVKAIVHRGETRLGCYTKDISRQGIGLLSPVEFQLAEQVQLHMPNGAEFHLEIMRCNRISDHCFECGARFIL